MHLGGVIQRLNLLEALKRRRFGSKSQAWRLNPMFTTLCQYYKAVRAIFVVICHDLNLKIVYWSVFASLLKVLS